MAKELFLNSLKITFKEIEYWTDHKKKNFLSLFEECNNIDKMENEYLFQDNENHKYIYYLVKGDVEIEINKTKPLDYEIIQRNLRNMLSSNLEYFKRITKKSTLNKGIFKNLVKKNISIDVPKSDKKSDNNSSSNFVVQYNKNEILKDFNKMKSDRMNIFKNIIDESSRTVTENPSNNKVCIKDIYKANIKKQTRIKNEISANYLKELHKENVLFYLLNNLDDFKAYMIGQKINERNDLDSYILIDYSSRLLKSNVISCNSWINIETIITEKDTRNANLNQDRNISEKKIKKIKWVKSSGFSYNTIYCTKLRNNSTMLLRISINNFLKSLYYFNSNSLKIISKIILDRVLNIRNLFNNSINKLDDSNNITFRDKMFQIFNYKYEVKKLIDYLKNTDDNDKNKNIEKNFSMINKMKNRLVKTKSAKIRYGKFDYLDDENNKIEVVTNKFILQTQVNATPISSNHSVTEKKKLELLNLFDIDDLIEFYNEKKFKKELKNLETSSILSSNTILNDKIDERNENIVDYSDNLTNYSNMNELKIINLSLINETYYKDLKENQILIDKKNQGLIKSKDNSKSSSIAKSLSKSMKSIKTLSKDNTLLIEALNEKYTPYYEKIISSEKNKFIMPNESDTVTTNIDSISESKNLKQRNVNFPNLITESNQSQKSKFFKKITENSKNRNIKSLSNIKENSNLGQISSNILITGKINLFRHYKGNYG